MSDWLIDQSALVWLGDSPDAADWAQLRRARLVRITTVTRLEVGYSARSAAQARAVFRPTPLAAMPVEYLTPAIEDRAVEVQLLLADQGQPLRCNSAGRAARYTCSNGRRYARWRLNGSAVLSWPASPRRAALCASASPVWRIRSSRARARAGARYRRDQQLRPYGAEPGRSRLAVGLGLVFEVEEDFIALAVVGV